MPPRTRISREMMTPSATAPAAVPSAPLREQQPASPWPVSAEPSQEPAGPGSAQGPARRGGDGCGAELEPAAAHGGRQQRSSPARPRNAAIRGGVSTLPQRGDAPAHETEHRTSARGQHSSPCHTASHTCSMGGSQSHMPVQQSSGRHGGLCDSGEQHSPTCPSGGPPLESKSGRSRERRRRGGRAA